MRPCPLGQHVEVTLRRQNALYARRQCGRCRSGIGKRIPLGELKDDGRSLPWWLTAQPGEGKGNSKRRNYAAFLRSAEWRAIRAEVLADLCRRQGGTVPICEGENCEEEATTVHHESYAPILAETPRKQLRGSCVGCNLNEREARIVRGVLGA